MTTKTTLAEVFRQVLAEHEHGALGGQDLAEALAAAVGTHDCAHDCVAERAIVKLRSLGLDDHGIRERLDQATKLEAAGATAEHVQVLAKIAAQARVTRDDILLLQRLDGMNTRASGDGAPRASAPRTSTAKVVTRGYGTDCASGICPGACSHLMWYCDRCTSEGGWGAPRDMLERWAAEHVCPTPPAQQGSRRCPERHRVEGHKMDCSGRTAPSPDRERMAHALWDFTENVISLDELNRKADADEADYAEHRAFLYRQVDAALALAAAAPAPVEIDEAKLAEVIAHGLDNVWDEGWRPDGHEVLTITEAVAAWLRGEPDAV